MAITTAAPRARAARRIGPDNATPNMGAATAIALRLTAIRLTAVCLDSINAISTPGGGPFMQANRFDHFAKSLGVRLSRRSAMTAGAGLVGLAQANPALAAQD